MPTMLLLLLVSLGLLAGFLIGGLLGAPWVPARNSDVEAMLEAADLRANQLYVELGCGDGRLVVAAVKKGARAIGYEINPLLWLFAWMRCIRYSRAHIRLANFWPKPLNEADVVMAFLMPKFMPRLASKAKKELKPGARLISYIFQIPDKHPVKKTDHWYVYKY
jgi:SAM-dependent methyltransferase